MSYETHWEPDGVRWVYRGVMTDDDILRSNLELYDDPRFDTLKYQIADLRGIESFEGSARAVRRLSRMDRDQAVRNPNVKVAILADEALVRGIANVYAMSGVDAPWETRVFESEKEARAWLAEATAGPESTSASEESTGE
ncbi:MAG: hypothetical protein GF405_03270 [Candidatus Eisenbacteria bacterium]|nr:hypothetical protein [Candidatus Eisenbacteria bacterium]